MPVRSRVSVTFTVSSDSRELCDLGHIEKEVLSDGCTDGGSTRITLPINATNLLIQLTEVQQGRALALFAEPKNPNDTLPEITVKLNATGNTPITMAPLPTTRMSMFVLTTSGLTALYVTNPSGTVPVELTLGMVGDT